MILPLSGAMKRAVSKWQLMTFHDLQEVLQLAEEMLQWLRTETRNLLKTSGALEV
jgi:hypothetical protein